MNPQTLSWFRKALEINEFSEKDNIRDTNERKRYILYSEFLFEETYFLYLFIMENIYELLDLRDLILFCLFQGQISCTFLVPKIITRVELIDWS